jgi:hypothetical protein
MTDQELNPYKATEHFRPAPRESCANCGATHSEKRKRTFLGFRKVTCPACRARTTFGLGGLYVTIYVLLGPVNLLGHAIAGLESFKSGFCSGPLGLLIMLAACAALALNFRIPRSGKVAVPRQDV